MSILSFIFQDNLLRTVINLLFSELCQVLLNDPIKTNYGKANCDRVYNPIDDAGVG